MAKAAGTNMDNATGFVDRIENLHGDLATLRAEYMNDCKALREDIKSVYGEAKDADIPVRALKAVVKTRELERKTAAVRDELDESYQNDFDAIRLKLGDLADLPLGQAALAVAAA